VAAIGLVRNRPSIDNIATIDRRLHNQGVLGSGVRRYNLGAAL
jgi:hypothetical protein